MADKKISALTAATTPLAGTEVLPIVQSGTTVKVAVSDLTAGRAIAAAGGTFSGFTTITTVDQSTNRLRFTNTGVGGTTFDIVGGLPGAGNFGLAIFDVNNTATRLFINTTGSVTAPEIYNTVIGATNRDLFVDSGGLLGYVPSIRAAKTNIKPLTDTSWVHALNAVSFNYKKRDAEGAYIEQPEDVVDYGLIAEEVAEINEDIVFYDDVDGKKELRGVSYSKLIVPLLKEVQSLKLRLDALENK